MENKIKKATKIVSIVGLSLIGLIGLIILLNDYVNIDFLMPVIKYANFAFVLALFGAIVLSIWLVKGKYNKIAQIVLSTGALVYLVYTILSTFNDSVEIINTIAMALFVAGGLMWIIALCVPKLRTKAIAPYALGIEMFVLGFAILLSAFGLDLDLFAYSAIISTILRTAVALISTLFLAMEYNNENSKKPLFVFATLLFVALIFSMYVTVFVRG